MLLDTAPQLDGHACYRPRVKFCGITRARDAACAAALGADAIGLVFYPPSPRAVTPGRARAVTEALPPFVSVVAVFVNPEPAAVHEVLEHVRVDLLQFHGHESAAECERYGRPYLKAIAVREGVDVAARAAHYGAAAGLLLDTYRPAQWGGTGRRFDWSLLPSNPGKPVVLAGGLTPESVGEAVARVRPYALDVSSGVEASGGIKDAAKMAAFMREVQRVGATEAEA